MEARARGWWEVLLYWRVSIWNHDTENRKLRCGASAGESDLSEAVRTAVVNKRGGGMGLISGRKAFQRPMREGVELLNAIQDVYLSPDVTVA